MRKGIELSKRFWLIYCLAWIPYALTYIAVFVTERNLEFVQLLYSVCRNLVSVAVLGIFVVLICNCLNWSRHQKIWFFPLHIFLAVIFAFVRSGILFLLFSFDNYFRTGKFVFLSFAGNALQWNSAVNISESQARKGKKRLRSKLFNTRQKSAPDFETLKNIKTWFIQGQFLTIETK